MATETKLAVILHADIVDSTRLVQMNETIAHDRIRSLFHHLSNISAACGGVALEIRGDALVAEFPRPSDAVSAAMKFQQEHRENTESVLDDVRPAVRIGIAMGEVVVADNTITGAGVVLAQRLEQLAGPGEVCISAAVRESLPGRLTFEYEDLGEHTLKGFSLAQRAFSVRESGKRVDFRGARPPNDEAKFAGPSLAVLPFATLGSDEDAEFLADGLTEDITSTMSALPWLTVISRASAIEVTSRTADLRQVGAELGVRFAVTGSVRKVGPRVRVTANLTDSRTGNQIWSNRFDRVLKDVFEIMDDVARSVAAELVPELTAVDLRLLEGKTPQNLNAWEAYQRGVAEILRRGDKEDCLLKAAQYFEHAVDQDPTFGSAYGALGHTVWAQLIRGMVLDTSSAIQRMFTLANKASELNPRDSAACVVRGLAYFLRQDYVSAVRQLDEGVHLNPSSALALALRGGVKTWSYTDHAGALVDLESARRLSPTDPESRLFRLGAGANAHLHLGQYEEAVQLGEESFRAGGFFGPLNGIAACVEAGDLAAAQMRVSEFLGLRPNVTIERVREVGFFMPDNDKWNRYLELIQTAGIPREFG